MLAALLLWRRARLEGGAAPGAEESASG